MACKLVDYAIIKDLRTVFEDWKTCDRVEDKEYVLGDADWNTEWTSKETDETDKLEIEFREWINNCHMAFSPAGDAIVVADNRRLAVLTRKYEKAVNDKENAVFCHNWSGTLCENQGDRITQVICIPIASQLKSSQGGPDWTCVVVGFTDGYIRVYEQSGGLLLSQQFHNEAVVRLKCRTQQCCDQEQSIFDTVMEEFVILYSSHLVIIEGFSLFQCLRACRNQLARAFASGITSDFVNRTNLGYKKLHLRHHSEIKDIISCGNIRINAFDCMQAISMTGSDLTLQLNTSVARYVTAGGDPVVGLYNAAEDAAPSFVSVVAFAVANKLKDAVMSQLSAASGWLGFGKGASSTQQKSQKSDIELGSPLQMRYGLPDETRVAKRIISAPSSALAVTVDNIARVILIDTEKGMAVRIWKGYRDAQCGWIQVFEPADKQASSTLNRRALFLIIYAPRRGILEIWLMQNGSRVGAFNIGKNCRLLYTGHGTLGARFGIKSDVLNPRGWNICQCLLLQPDGNLQSVSIPFYCALSKKEGAELRDKITLDALSQLINCLAVEEGTTDLPKENELKSRLTKIFDDFVLSTSFKQAMYSVLSCPKVPLRILLHIIETLKAKSINEKSQETKHLHFLCCVQQKLLHAYDLILNSKYPECHNKVMLAEHIGLNIAMDELEFERLLKSLECYLTCCNTISSLSESEHSGHAFSATRWLNCYDLSSLEGNQSNFTQEIEVNDLTLSNNMIEEDKRALGAFIFHDILVGKSSASGCLSLLQSFGVDPLDILSILHNYWLYAGRLTLYQDLKDVVERLYSLNLIFISNRDLERLTTHRSTCGDTVILWWEHFHDMTCQTYAIGEAVLMALVMKKALKAIENHKKTNLPTSESNSSEWVELTKERVQWTLTYQRLLDLVAVCNFVYRAFTIETGESTTSEGSRISRMRSILRTICLKNVLLSGKAFLPNLVSECLVDNCLSINAVLSPSTKEDDIDSSVWSRELARLQENLPQLLNSSNIACHCILRFTSLWKEDKENVYKMKCGINLLDCIRCPVVQRGMCIKLWRDYFSNDVHSVLKLMEKIGKAPKNRLCRKTVGMNEDALEEFLRLAVFLLDVMMKVSDDDIQAAGINTTDELWSEISGERAVVEKLLDENCSNRNLVALQHQLCSILYLIMSLRMRSVRPLTLFDSKSKQFLFEEITKETTSPTVVTDDSLVKIRTKFGLSVATAITSMLPPSTDESSYRCSREIAASSSLHQLEVLRRICNAFNGIDKDEVDRKIVCELFLRGYDELAHEATPFVEDQPALGKQLLKIANQRLAVALFVANSAQQNASRWSGLPSHIYNWIKSEENNTEKVSNPPLRDTISILQLASKALPKDSEDYATANSVVDAIDYLR